jgi:hypothetical protein
MNPPFQPIPSIFELLSRVFRKGLQDLVEKLEPLRQFLELLVVVDEGLANRLASHPGAPRGMTYILGFKDHINRCHRTFQRSEYI